MGKLAFLEKIRDEGNWYFSDAHWSTDSRKCAFAWPNPDYAFSAGIHFDKVTNKLRIAIRKWIEQNLDGTVIVSTVDHNYHRYYGEERTWDNSYQVSNYWMVFHFEDESSELAFRLIFSEYVTPVTKHHPKYPEDETWCNATPVERLEM